MYEIEKDSTVTKYYVTFEHVCVYCNGAGWRQSPVWEQFVEETKDPWGMSEEETVKWFNEHASNGEYYRSWSDLPPEEVQCWECEGEGKATGRIDLREALAALGVKTPIWTTF